MTHYEQIEDYYMARCLALAVQGRGTVSPNPMVGAVVLDAQGKKVGEGFHPYVGGPHAEVVALDQAGDKARGGTLYVNLEPCNHTGRTPPCSHRIIEAGIERVICGTLDPNPAVAGGGRDHLQNHRISVRHGFLETECRQLNESFFQYVSTGKPFVTLKLAMTLDGKIATRSGKSQWITGDFSRQYVHYLRQAEDAILTTADTIMADNPQLTVRDAVTPFNPPVRVILDRRFKLDPDQYQIFNTDVAPTWVITSAVAHNPTHAQKAQAKGVTVLTVSETGQGLDLNAVFTLLGKHQIARVWVEAGGGLSGALVTQKLVDKYYLFYGPKLLSDPASISGVIGQVQLSLEGAPALCIVQTRQLEQDCLIEAYPL